MFGILNTEIKEPIYCTEEAIWANPKNVEPANTCTSYINKVEIYSRIVANCQNKGHCVIPTTNWWNSDSPTWIND